MDESHQAENLQSVLPFAAEDLANSLNDFFEAPAFGDFGLEPMDENIPTLTASGLDPSIRYPLNDRVQQDVSGSGSVTFGFELLEPSLLGLPPLNTNHLEQESLQHDFWGNHVLEPDFLEPDFFRTDFYKPETAGPSHSETKGFEIEASTNQRLGPSFVLASASQEMLLRCDGADDQLDDYRALVPPANDFYQSGSQIYTNNTDFYSTHGCYPDTRALKSPQVNAAGLGLGPETLDTILSHQLPAPGKNLAFASTPPFLGEDSGSSSAFVPKYLTPNKDSENGAVGFGRQISSRSDLPMPDIINTPAEGLDTSLPPPTTSTPLTEIRNAEMMPPLNTPRQILKEPSSADWKMLRPIVHSLYIHDDRPLIQVVKVLKERFGFKISEKMLKDRVKPWGQIKNLTQNDKEAIMRRIENRKSAHKRSQVRFNGELLPLSKIACRRSKQPPTIPDEVARIQSSTPPGIRFYTPPASPLSTPRILELPEQMFKFATEYIAAGFGMELWVSVGESDYLRSKQQDWDEAEILNDMMTGLSLYMNNHTNYAKRMISRVHGSLERFIAMQPIDITTKFVLLVYRYVRRGKLDEIKSTIHAVSIIAARVHGPLHPIARIFAFMHSYLGEVEASVLLTALSKISAAAIDSFENALGPLHMSALDYRLEYLLQFMRHHDYERGLSTLRRLMQECDKVCLGLKDLRWFRSRFTLMLYFIQSDDSKRWQEAIDIGADLLGRFQWHEFPSAWSASFSAKCHFLLGQAQMRLGQVETGSFHFMEGIRITVLSFGAQDAQVLQTQCVFVSWLRYYGRLEAADKIEKQMDAFNIPFDNKDGIAAGGALDNPTHEAKYNIGS